MIKSFSHAALKDFSGCERRFYHVRWASTVKAKYDPSHHGRGFHTAMSLAVQQRRQHLPDCFKEHEWALTDLDKIEQRMIEQHPDTLTFRHATLGLGLMPDWSSCGKFSKGAYYSTTVDFLMERGDLGYITNFRFGQSAYADPEQLVQQALCVFTAKPNLNTIRAQLTYVPEHIRIPHVPMVIERTEMATIQQSIVNQTQEIMEKDINVPDDWIPTPSQLCGHCPVKEEHCEHRAVHLRGTPDEV